MQWTPFLKISTATITLMLAACNNYSVSVNNNTVYTPAGLFKDYSIADSHLQDCVQQTIADKHITKVEELKQLNCSNAGISSLSGLEKFYRLEQLNLTENKLDSIAPLAELTQIKTLILRKNALTSAEPLLHLMHLRELDISENGKLTCGDLNQLKTNFHNGELKIALPEQCKG